MYVCLFAFAWPVPDSSEWLSFTLTSAISPSSWCKIEVQQHVCTQGGCDANFVPVLCTLWDWTLFEWRLATQSNSDLFFPHTCRALNAQVLSLHRPQCLYCMPYHIFIHLEHRTAVSIQKRKTKKWLSIIVALYEMGGLSLRFWQQASFSHKYRDPVKEMNRWMDGGGGGNIDHVLWARQSDSWGDGDELPLVFLSPDPPSQHSCPR